MHAEPGSASSAVHRAAGTSGTDLVETLLARVDDFEEQLRAIPTATDEKALKELRRTIEALSKRDPKFEERVTNRVDVVADRIETVAKTISTTAAALAAKDGEIAQLRRELEAGKDRADAAVADLRRSLDPSALPEIKRALAALSEQKLPRGLEGRVEDLNAKLGMLSQRIDSVSSTVSTTAGGLAGRDGDIIAFRRTYDADTARIDAELADVRRANDPAPVAELRHAVKELSDAAFGQKRSTQRHLDDVGTKIDALVGRLDSVATSLAAATTSASAREEEIAALRALVEDGSARVGSLVSELKQTVVALATQAAALEEADGEVRRLVEARVSGADDKADGLAARLDSLTTTVEATSDQLAEQKSELAGSERRFQEASARVHGLVGELTRALEEFPDPDSVEQALEPRLDELGAQVAEVAGLLAHVEATLTQKILDATSESAELERLLVAEGGKVDGLATRLDVLATSAAVTLARTSGNEDEISALRVSVEDDTGRLGSLAEELSETVAALSRRAAALEELESEAARGFDERISGVSGSVDYLSTRLESLAGAVRTATDRSSERGTELDALRSELTGRFDAIERERAAATEATQAAARSHEVVGTRVEELAARLDAAEEERNGTSAEVTRLAAILEVERASLRTRLDTLATAQEKWESTVDTSEIERRLGRFDALELEHEAMAAAVERLSSAIAEERASVQPQLEALAAALALPVSASQHPGLEARLEALTRKLDEVDRRGAAVASDVARATVLWPTALRSLEARLEEIAPRRIEPGADLDGERLRGFDRPEPPADGAHLPETEHEPSSEDIFERAVTTIGADVVPLRAADP